MGFFTDFADNMSRRWTRSSEIAPTTPERDTTIGYTPQTGIIMPSDLVTGSADMFAAYDTVLDDDQVWSVFQQRRLSIVGTQCIVKPGADDSQSKQAAEHLQMQLDGIDFDSATDGMLYAIFYGYAVAECMWGKQENKIVLNDILVRSQRRFGFDVNGNLLLRTRANLQGEKMPPRKFWVYRYDGMGRTDSHYGRGLAHYLYWPTTLKKSAMKAWVHLLDKYGAPTAVGRFPPSATQEDRKKLLNALSMMASSSGIIVPESVEIELLEPSRGGNAGFNEFVSLMNSAISKIVLSQTMTTDDGSSLSQSQVHQQVKQEVIKADASSMAGSFNNSIAEWLTAWNFPGAVTPEIEFVTDIAEDQTAVAERMAIICNATGYRPTLEYITNTFGGEWNDQGNDQDADGREPANPNRQSGSDVAGPDDTDIVADESGDGAQV
jgi:phage gp29-like protein